MGNLVPTILLIFITIVWGWSFVLVKDAIEEYGVISFLAVRFVIASVLMAPLSARRITRASLRTGTLIGLVLAAIYISQTFGLRYTTATKSGLITGLFIVFAPLANRTLFGVRTTWIGWAAIGLSFLGLALLTGAGPGRFNFGDFLTLVGALFIGVYIALMDRHAKQHDAAAFAWVQVLVSTVLFLAIWPATEPVRWPASNVWLALLVTGAIGTAAGAYVQTIVQQRLPAVRVAIIIALTPVFAAFFGYALAGDRLSGLQVVGAILMIGAAMAAEVLGSDDT